MNCSQTNINKLSFFVIYLIFLIGCSKKIPSSAYTNIRKDIRMELRIKDSTIKQNQLFHTDVMIFNESEHDIIFPNPNKYNYKNHKPILYLINSQDEIIPIKTKETVYINSPIYLHLNSKDSISYSLNNTFDFRINEVDNYRLHYVREIFLTQINKVKIPIHQKGRSFELKCQKEIVIN